MSKQICHFVARNFGLKTNALHFELLPRALPIQILAKHKNKLFQLEALLFGTAGLLNERLLGDDYFLALRKKYSFLHKKITSSSPLSRICGSFCAGVRSIFLPFDWRSSRFCFTIRPPCFQAWSNWIIF
tara:strand:- start:9437 stop:9823 length:387 start_codon:yes stop_codon:yes gene_type:complete